MSLTRPVAYLEIDDFNADGKLINPDIPKGKPVVIMLQAGWCPHCVSAKPAFQEFANKNKGKVFCVTIQSDGERQSEKDLGKIVEKVYPGFRGFPSYMGYKNGKPYYHNGGRTAEDLEKFVNTM